MKILPERLLTMVKHQVMNWLHQKNKQQPCEKCPLSDSYMQIAGCHCCMCIYVYVYNKPTSEYLGLSDIQIH